LLAVIAVIAELPGLLLPESLQQSLENLARRQPLFSPKHAKHENAHSTTEENHD
jgi:hypothetical protein